MKLLFRTFAILMVILITTTSCDDDNKDSNSNIKTFKATLNGTSERPNPVTTSAMGTATLTFNNTTKMFTVTGTYTGMAPNAAHIHGPATTEQTAAPVFTLNVTTISSGTISLSSTALTPTQEADLKNGLYYINVHSVTYPGGEIRGQLITVSSGGGGGGGGY